MVYTCRSGASPTVTDGQVYTRLMPFSAANSVAALSISTLDTGYACRATSSQWTKTNGIPIQKYRS